ncbi:uncharacterized protein LOC119278484 [Triticum dicoccoides]|uniref:uncharacterized protein LOC119278484 n=1 Tax=Triticum dicoccoides TaxID=85692 RepID=UPI00188DED8A|nr:uncharacterized protein LOC119278484 [Triticum dicoccoides]
MCEQYAVCRVCLNRCDYERNEDSFSMYVSEAFKNRGVVACNERVHFDIITGEEVTFVANTRTYTVRCYKGRTHSAMYGSGWKKFYEDNKLGKGQLVYFFLDQPSPMAAILFLQLGNGSKDEDPMEGDDEDADEYDEHGGAPHDNDEGIVRTRGFELNEIEESELQGLLPLSDRFVGLPFIHRLTRTNVHLGMMKIPKKVAAATLFEEHDFGIVCMDGGNFKRIPYRTYGDGRIVNVNNVVLFGFKNSKSSEIDSFVITRKLG